MTTLGQLADFAHPQPVAEPGPPLGKAYRGQSSRRQAYVGGEKLLLRPILAGIFAIGQACNASVLHLDEKNRAVTFAIKHHGKTMKQRISLKLVRAWLVRHIIFKARDDVAFQHLQQAWIDGLAHHKKWLAVHGVDPIIRRGAQTQALARDVMLGSLLGVAVVTPTMAINVDNGCLSRRLRPPLFAKPRTP